MQKKLYFYFRTFTPIQHNTHHGALNGRRTTEWRVLTTETLDVLCLRGMKYEQLHCYLANGPAERHRTVQTGMGHLPWRAAADSIAGGKP